MKGIQHARDAVLAAESGADAVVLSNHGGRVLDSSPATIFSLPRVVEAVGKRIPVRRWGVGDDFSGLAVYLASDLSAYHTGDNFIIDGGYAIF